jgi:hypothetical protein
VFPDIALGASNHFGAKSLVKDGGELGLVRFSVPFSIPCNLCLPPVRFQFAISLKSFLNVINIYPSVRSN